MNFLFILIAKDNSVIWVYKVKAENKAKALNEFAQFIISDANLQYDIINTTYRIDILEEPIQLWTAV